MEGKLMVAGRQAIAHDVAGVLRQVVVDELERRSLLDADVLANALGIARIKSTELLRRTRWEIETSMALIEAFDLPIVVEVNTRDAAHQDDDEHQAAIA